MGCHPSWSLLSWSFFLLTCTVQSILWSVWLVHCYSVACLFHWSLESTICRPARLEARCGAFFPHTSLAVYSSSRPTSPLQGLSVWQSVCNVLTPRLGTFPCQGHSWNRAHLRYSPPVGFFRMTEEFGLPLPVGSFPTLSSQDLGFAMSATILWVGSALDPAHRAVSCPREPYKV